MSKGPSAEAAAFTSHLRRPDTNAVGNAHYIVDGVPLCASRVLLDGRPALAPFLCTWVEERAFDRRCRYCRRELARSAPA